MSKIKAKGIVSQAVGPTFTKNDPAKFGNGGGKKTMAAKPVDHAVGPTQNVNSTHISTPNADKAPRATKVLSTGKGESPHAGSYAKNASDVGSSGGQPHGCLKSSYEK